MYSTLHFTHSVCALMVTTVNPDTYVSLSTVVLTSRGRHERRGIPLLHALITCITIIKTHDSESRGQEEAGRTRRTSELFTRSTALKFVNALNKLP